MKEGIIHPLPAFPNNTLSKDGRFFNVWNKLFMLAGDGLYKIKTDESGFDLIASQTFDTTQIDYWKIVEFQGKGTLLNTFSVGTTASDIANINIATTLGENVYSGMQVEILQGGTTSKGVYYINTNTKDTLYIDGLLDYVPGSGDTVKIYAPTNILAIYDGYRLYQWDGASITDQGVIGNGAFMEVFSNRLYIFNDTKITFSSFNTISYFPKTGYAYTVGRVWDTRVMANQVYIYTTHGTYVLQGTGYTTLNLIRTSEFKTDRRVYPVVHKDNQFINSEGRLYGFADRLGTQYNYRLIPDTASKLFTIQEGVLFNLGHSMGNKWACLNVEEVENRQQIVITNFIDADIRDVATFNQKVWINDGGVIKKENGLTPIKFTSNLISYTQRVFWDTMTLLTAGNPPATIEYYNQGAWTTQPMDEYGHSVDYKIRKYDTGMKIRIVTDQPIVSISIAFKI